MKPTHGNVILVDDDPAMLRLLSTWLGSEDYSVRCCENGRQALDAIEQAPPDILITDWEMPEMDGPELCRRVRQLDLPHYVYILFLTVRSAPREVVIGLEVGADDYLSKPVLQGELLARMQSGARVLELEHRLSRIARTDPLTGLITQRAFYEGLDKEWDRSTRYHVPLSCVMLDVDFFKRVNDTYGHPAGDAVLEKIAEVLRSCCRGADTVSRYGGEEFCVMLPETDESGAARWAERSRQKLSDTTIHIGQKQLHVTASFGVAQQHDDTQTPAQLVDRADQALLCAKQSGRDRVVAFESLDNTKSWTLTEMGEQGDLFRGVTARHVMAPLVVCLRQEQTIGQATEFFLRTRINSTPVIDTEGRLAGILSEKDLMAAMVGPDAWSTPIDGVMKPHVIYYEEDTPLRVIYEFLCRVSIRRVVIVRDGQPTGVVSRGTLLRWFQNMSFRKSPSQLAGASKESLDSDERRASAQLAETAKELARRAAELQQRCEEDTEDLVPLVVGGVTGMQELVNDLLAYSHYVGEWRTSPESAHSMMLGAGHMD